MIGRLTGNFLRNARKGRGAGRVPGWRERPDCVVLAPDPALPPSGKAPVRIFVGTEPGQYRAERVLVHSVERVRNRARRYEIHLMRDLVGFDRTRWLTGFTNYRFAIPHFAGAAGRAIYNDVDQIYLDDPALLFDMDMDGHGFLALSEKDTAVMLIDCARMAPVWPIDEVRVARRKPIEAKAQPYWGPLPAPWHCRDEEYREGWSKVLHFTTIHEQPWQPFPEVFAYQRNPVGHVWLAMEREAMEAGSHVFSAAQPSPRYVAMRDAAAAAPAQPAAHRTERADAAVADLLRQMRCETTLYVSRGSSPCSDSGCASDTVGALALAGSGPGRRWDGVVCTGALERLPFEDAPWVIDRLFELAARALHIEVARIPAVDDGIHDEAGSRDAAWWTEVVTESAARHPHVRWQLVVRNALDGQGLVCRQGGPKPNGARPTVWILADHKLGHTTQSVGLADALGLPYEIKQLAFNKLQKLDNRLLGASLVSVDQSRSAALTPPWPDLVIATGRTVSPAARWIGERSGGRTRTVQMGRRGVHPRPDAFDLSVTCSFFGYPVHTRRVETVAPLTAIHDRMLQEAAARWQGLFDGMPAPHVALLVGGSSAAHDLDAATASRMTADVIAAARAAGGSAYIVTSPRTSSEATAAIRAAVATAPGDDVRLYEWKRGDAANPYLGCLALADVLVVTGDSESMLAEAAATDKPLYIYPVPADPGNAIRRLRGRIAERAGSRVRKQKGTIRPQQGLELLCARLIELGIVRPPRNPAEFHRRLIEGGFARPFGQPLSTDPRPALREIGIVAERVRALLGLPPAARETRS